MKLSLGDIIKIVETEPEYDGEPSIELIKVFDEIIIHGSRDRLIQLLRSSASLTKRCIIARIVTAATASVDKEEDVQDDNV